jgi:hypothetical protein
LGVSRQPAAARAMRDGAIRFVQVVIEDSGDDDV